MLDSSRWWASDMPDTDLFSSGSGHALQKFVQLVFLSSNTDQLMRTVKLHLAHNHHAEALHAAQSAAVPSQVWLSLRVWRTGRPRASRGGGACRQRATSHP